MAVFGQGGCIKAKVVVFGHSGCNRAKLDVFNQSRCIRAKVVVFGKMWLYCGKSVCCIRAKYL